MKCSLFFILMHCASNSAFSSEWNLGQLNNHQGAFYLGLLTGFAGHEAEAEDIQAEFHGVTTVYPDENLSDK